MVIKKFRRKLAYSIILAFSLGVLTGCGDNDGNNQNNSSTITDDKPPLFSGFTLVTSGNTDQVSASWQPANDNVTSKGNMGYKLYYDTVADFTPGSSNLYKHYNGMVTATIDELNADTRYYLKIIAIDEAGNQTLADDYAAVTTADAPVVRTNTVVNHTKDLNLGSVTIDNLDSSIYVFEITANTITPDVGSILIIEDSDGRGYLRRVDDITEGNTTLTIGTSDASLSDVFETFSISTEAVLLVEETNNNTNAPAKQATSNISSSVYGISNKGINHQTKTTTTTPKKSIKISREFSYATVNDAITLTGSIREFRPVMRADIRQHGWAIDTASFQTKGTLTLDLTLQYDYKGVASIKENKEFFSIPYRFSYPVGPVLVYQEIIFTLSAEFTGTAETTVKAQTNTTLSIDIDANAHYNGSEWTSSATKSFNPELTVSVEANGIATADVRLIPEVSTRFYSIATAALSVEPYMSANIEATAIAENDLLNDEFIGAYGLTSFDAFLGIDANIMAELAIFNRTISRYPVSGTENIFNINTQLFGLPTINATAEKRADGKYDLIATTIPFTNTFGLTNSFDQDSAEWIISPGNKSLAGMSAVADENISKSYFTGHSEILGEIGKQFIDVPLEKRFWRGNINSISTEVLPSTSYPLIGPASNMCSWFLTHGTHSNVGFGFLEGSQKDNIRFNYGYTPFGTRCNSSQAIIPANGGFTVRAYIDNVDFFGGDATGQQDLMINLVESFNDGEIRSGTFEGTTTFDFEAFRPSYGSMSIKCTGTWEVELKNFNYQTCPY